MEFNIIRYVVATAAGVITLVVSVKALKHFLIFDNPVISICVGLLTFLSFLELGDSWVPAVLIPYQALGLVVLVMFFVYPFLTRKKKDKPHKRFDDKWPSQKRGWVTLDHAEKHGDI